MSDDGGAVDVAWQGRQDGQAAGKPWHGHQDGRAADEVLVQAPRCSGCIQMRVCFAIT